MSFIEIDGVDLVYPGSEGARGDAGTPALLGAALRIEEGEFVSIVGPSGCGKSTLVKLIAGLVRPTRGSVRVAGAPVTQPLKTVGVAFQNPTLLPWRNIRDNVLLPLEIVEPYRGRFRRERAANRERVDRLLDSVGLAEFAHRMPWQLSGGMQQRAQLCRALIHEPAILLLDEPFAALDAFTREELWGVLEALWALRKCTVVLVTHELREAVYLADRVHIMSTRPGRVVLSKAIALARPRSLEASFGADFVELVHELRHHIGKGRAS